MSYLKQKHTALILVGFFLSSMMFVVFPELDIIVSKLFYNDGFYYNNIWWESLLYNSVKPFLLMTLFSVLIIWQFNRIQKKSFCSIDGRKVSFLFLVLIVGSGIFVNVIFKDQMGRARPRDITEFNGTKKFTPAFYISDACDRNCSFSSGHGSAAFYALALAMLFKRRRWALTLAFIYGTLVSFSRVVSGGHFLSDNVVSFFVMAICADSLYYLLFVRNQVNLNTAPTANTEPT